MGCCVPIDKNKVISSKGTAYTNKNTNDFKEIREILVQKIRDFQKIIVDCLFEAETCIINQDKTTAQLIKSRKACVKVKQEEMQVLVEKIDNFLENTFFNAKTRVELEKKYDSCYKDLTSKIIFSNGINILENDPSIIEKVKKEILEYNINQKDIEAELQEEINAFISKQEKDGCIRRKYIKTMCEE